MRVLSGTGYNYAFATPRAEPGFSMRRARFRDFGRLWRPLSGFAVVDPRLPADLIHAYNGPPTRLVPFVVSYESYLPRVLGGFGGEAFKRVVQGALAADRCRLLAPLSRHAAQLTRAFNADFRRLDVLEAKMRVIAPSVPALADTSAVRDIGQGPLELIFVGNHFGRKGGLACLYLSDLLERAGVAHRLHVIGRREFGIDIWTDTEADFYEAALAADRPSVTFHARLPNAEVLALLARAHFMLLPTLDDTYGFSLLEAMASGCVGVAPAIRAIPEIIEHRRTGLLLEAEVDELGRWRGLEADRARRAAPAYRTRLEETQRAYAGQAFAEITRLLDDPGAYRAMAAAALAHVAREHHPLRQAETWGQAYRAALA